MDIGVFAFSPATLLCSSAMLTFEGLSFFSFGNRALILKVVLGAPSCVRGAVCVGV